MFSSGACWAMDVEEKSTYFLGSQLCYPVCCRIYNRARQQEERVPLANCGTQMVECLEVNKQEHEGITDGGGAKKTSMSF